MHPHSRRQLLHGLAAAALVACAPKSGPGGGGGGADSAAPPVDSADPTDSADTSSPLDTADTADSAEPIDLCEGREQALPTDCSTATSPDGEGPNYRAGAPFRDDLRVEGEGGIPFVVSGRLINTACAPISNAELDIWQAGPDGKYDLTTDEFRWRGKVLTDANGGYCFTTVIPPVLLKDPATLSYNVPHIHIKVFLDGTELFNTQLAFPEEVDLPEGATLEEKPEDRQLTVEHLADGTARVSFLLVLGPTPPADG